MVHILVARRVARSVAKRALREALLTRNRRRELEQLGEDAAGFLPDQFDELGDLPF